MRYHSTRDKSKTITASQAILMGLAEDGGLFVPETIPHLKCKAADMADMTYQEVAYEVMSQYFTDFTEEELKACINAAYDEKFDTSKIVPFVEKGDKFIMELFHGPTLAFKDMALSILPHLMVTSAKKNQATEELVILTATSGDTGKAAMEGFADVPGTRIIVFYPKDGVADTQEQQMLTQKGDNTYVVGIQGNFDDAQRGVKTLFKDQELAKVMLEQGYRFSSANSINIGRLVPQIVYYVYAYAKLIKQHKIIPGQELNVSVPTGNFGNILAAYLAKQMGVPLGELLCASNENNVLTDFFNTGVYDSNRELVKTTSPSMDILVSSNLERYLYFISGESTECITEMMKEMESTGRFSIPESMQDALKAGIYAQFADAMEVQKTTEAMYRLYGGYPLDPHTAIAVAVTDRYGRISADDRRTLVAATASPYKFLDTVVKNMDVENFVVEEALLPEMVAGITGVAVPQAILDLREAPIRHNRVCEKTKMKETVMGILGI